MRIICTILEKKWNRRTSYKKGDPYIDLDPLVPAELFLLPPLHIKLGLVKNFIKSLVGKKKKNDKNGKDYNETMEFLSLAFPKLSSEKLKEDM